MQEGIMSFMQMVKIFAVVKYYLNVGFFYLIILIDLMIGGVIVFFVMEGDIILVELQSLVGFVGCCVIENMVCESLFEDF